MKIVKIEAQNFMKLKNINLALKDKGLIQVTGKNGAGKSTLVKLIEWLFEGPTSIQRKQKKSVVRNGTDKAWGSLELNDPQLGSFVVTRSLTSGNFQNLDFFDQDGKRVLKAQDVLDAMFTGLTFDPLVFAQMDSEGQIEELKRLGQVDLDFAALDQADLSDAEQRKDLKKEVTYVENQIADLKRAMARDEIVILDGMPTEKIDETVIFERLNKASTANRKAQAINQARDAKRLHVAGLEQDRSRKVDEIEQIRREIEALKQKLEATEQSLIASAQDIETAEAELQASPEAKLIDVAALAKELQDAQRTNRAIDGRAQYDQLHQQFEDKQAAVKDLSDRIKDREKLRKDAMTNAKLPVEGLSFDESQVYYGELPLASLGEGEQIRISTLLGIYMNPTLRCMCIQHGEALDDDGLKVIEQLAVEHDFQILMARVETSGEVGIVIEDGRVAADNYRADYKPTQAKAALTGPKGK